MDKRMLTLAAMLVAACGTQQQQLHSDQTIAAGPVTQSRFVHILQHDDDGTLLPYSASYDEVEADLRARTTEFLARCPNHQCPIIPDPRADGGRTDKNGE